MMKLLINTFIEIIGQDGKCSLMSNERAVMSKKYTNHGTKKIY
jgi:hypothetical protein